MKLELNVRRNGATAVQCAIPKQAFLCKEIRHTFYMGLLKPETVSKLNRGIHSYAMKLKFSVLRASSYYLLVVASTSVNFREKTYGRYAITI
jgi:hypothetical protein